MLFLANLMANTETTWTMKLCMNKSNTGFKTAIAKQQLIMQFTLWYALKKSHLGIHLDPI